MVGRTVPPFDVVWRRLPWLDYSRAVALFFFVEMANFLEDIEVLEVGGEIGLTKDVYYVTSLQATA